MAVRFDGLAFAAFLFLFFLGFNIFQGFLPVQAANQPAPITPTPPVPGKTVNIEPALHDPRDEIVIPPYPSYNLTQGLHGYEYGHMAVDLVAGKNSPILASIQGVVTDRFIDQYNNPTLIIENQNYRVILLHGEFSVVSGQAVQLGQQIGVESNLGYTLDSQGRACTNRNCGYHTHLNVFDKRSGQNVNPLEVFQTDIIP